MTFLNALVMAAADPKSGDEAWCRQLAGLLVSQLESDGESSELAKVKGLRIVGQNDLVRRLTMTALLNENILLQGLPGVAKTTAVKFLAQDTGLTHQRVQFFPDMQPSDLVGKDQFSITKLHAASASGAAANEEDIRNWQDGPLFNNDLVADEINRAPSKVQAALLEAMGERQITPLGHRRHVIRPVREWQMWLRYIRSLQVQGQIKGRIWGAFAALEALPVSELTPEALQPVIAAICNQRSTLLGDDFPFGSGSWTDPSPLFMASGINLEEPADSQFSVFATQNPIEQQGTYPLAEAAIDRFCFKTVVRYPDYESTREIVKMINPPKATGDPDPKYTREPEKERTAKHREDRDLALRSSLYFCRRCRELMFGRPGKIEGSRLGTLLSSTDTLDKILRINFYTHIKMPQAGRLGEAERLLGDLEQQDRMNYLHASHPDDLPLLAGTDGFQYVNSGASPRGFLQLTRAAICEAFMGGKDPSQGVSDDDIRAVAPDVLGHRIRLNSQARVRGISPESLLAVILDQVLH